MSSSNPSSTPTSPVMSEKSSRRKSLQRFMSKLVKKPKNKDNGDTESPTSPVLKDEKATEAPQAPSTSAAAPPAAAATTKAISPAERARIIAMKHDVELADDWPFPAKQPGERVEKPIRMRVHRFCHRCEAPFGGEKVCGSCQHKRCKNCPRTPAKKDKKKSTKPKKDIYSGLTLPNKNGGEPLVHKNIRHRVHWKCHRCEADFGSETLCKGCQHNRCKRCERDPPRKKKTVEEGGEKKERVKRPVKWTCHECQNAHEGVRECECGHSRCKDCPRQSSRQAREKAAEAKPITEQIGDALKSITIS